MSVSDKTDRNRTLACLASHHCATGFLVLQYKLTDNVILGPKFPSKLFKTFMCSSLVLTLPSKVFTMRWTFFFTSVLTVYYKRYKFSQPPPYILLFGILIPSNWNFGLLKLWYMPLQNAINFPQIIRLFFFFLAFIISPLALSLGTISWCSRLSILRFTSSQSARSAD